jgi:acyl dehydratase
VSNETLAEPTQLFFEDVDVGTRVPEREYGPHDVVTAVFWAGVQENPGLLHLDRDHARQFRRAPSIVASGALRQSFLTKTLTDWAGPRAFVRSMEFRHTASTYEGDMQRYTATVVEKSADSNDPWIVLEVDGRNQNDEQIIAGRCTLLLPGRSWPVDRPVWEAV